MNITITDGLHRLSRIFKQSFLILLIAGLLPSIPLYATQDAQSYLEQGIMHYQRGEFSEAIEAFEIALQLKPEDPTTLSYLQEAHTELETLIASHLEQGQMLFSQNTFNEARKEYEEILRLDPEHSEGTNIHACIQLIQEGSQLIPEYSSEVQASLQDGLKLIKDGDLSTALQHFSELQKTLQEPAKLAEYIERIRDTQQQLITFHIKKGQEYFITELLEKAIQEWKLVLHLDPSHNQAAKFIARTSRLLDTLLVS